MCCVGYVVRCVLGCVFFFFQAEDGIRDLVRSRGLGDVYKRQGGDVEAAATAIAQAIVHSDAHNAEVRLPADGGLYLSLIHI